jgi:hypothetical protein
MSVQNYCQNTVYVEVETRCTVAHEKYCEDVHHLSNFCYTMAVISIVP